MGSGASFYLVGVLRQLSRKPILKTRDFRDFKLCSHRSSPHLPTGKAQDTPTFTLSCSCQAILPLVDAFRQSFPRYQ